LQVETWLGRSLAPEELLPAVSLEVLSPSQLAVVEAIAPRDTFSAMLYLRNIVPSALVRDLQPFVDDLASGRRMSRETERGSESRAKFAARSAPQIEPKHRQQIEKWLHRQLTDDELRSVDSLAALTNDQLEVVAELRPNNLIAPVLYLNFVVASATMNELTPFIDDIAGILAARKQGEDSRPNHDGDTMNKAARLVARSASECHLYIELHPCSCGEPPEPGRHRLQSRDDGLVAVYEMTCRRCGATHRVEFAMGDEIAPLGAFGGQTPSQIIDPGEFLAVADAAAQQVPADADRLDDAGRGRARSWINRAAAAVAEALKFIPAGEDRVPRGALRSVQGAALYEQEPGRFRRSRLEAVLQAYRDAAAKR
jgi:hypothetical protein